MANTTKDLNRTLKKGDLMSIAVGQIIGAGVMVMSIAALGMTGRSVNIAFRGGGGFDLFRGAAVDLYGLHHSCYGRFHIHRRLSL